MVCVVGRRSWCCAKWQRPSCLQGLCCPDGESAGPLGDESLFTFKPLRWWCDSLYRLEVTQGPETEPERERASELEEVCRWLEVLRGIVSALFQRDVGRRGGVTPPLSLLPLRPLPAVTARLSAESYCSWKKGKPLNTSLGCTQICLCLDLQGQKVSSFDLINYPTEC